MSGPNPDGDRVWVWLERATAVIGAAYLCALVAHGYLGWF